MKRDMELVRVILAELENSDSTLDVKHFVDKGWSKELIVYHLKILDDAGLIDAEFLWFSTGKVESAKAFGLTWAGCDYLDAIRSDTVWSKTKQVISDSVGTTSFEVVKEVAKAVALKSISVGLGFPL